jgi:hypothetical protein
MQLEFKPVKRAIDLLIKIYRPFHGLENFINPLPCAHAQGFTLAPAYAG